MTQKRKALGCLGKGSAKGKNQTMSRLCCNEVSDVLLMDLVKGGQPLGIYIQRQSYNFNDMPYFKVPLS